MTMATTAKGFSRPGERGRDTGARGVVAAIVWERERLLRRQSERQYIYSAWSRAGPCGTATSKPAGADEAKVAAAASLSVIF